MSAGDGGQAGETGGSSEHAHTSGSLTAAITVNQGGEISYVQFRPSNLIDMNKQLRMSNVGYIETVDTFRPAGSAVEGITENATTLPPYRMEHIWRRLV